MTLRMEAMIPTWLWRSWEMWLLSAFYHRLVKVATFKNLLFLNVQDPDFGSVCVSGEEGGKVLGSLWAGIWVHVEFWWHAELLKELLNRNIWFKGHFLVCVGSAGITAQFLSPEWGTSPNLLCPSVVPTRREWRWEVEWSDAGGLEIQQGVQITARYPAELQLEWWEFLLSHWECGKGGSYGNNQIYWIGLV